MMTGAAPERRDAIGRASGAPLILCARHGAGATYRAGAERAVARVASAVGCTFSDVGQRAPRYNPSRACAAAGDGLVARSRQRVLPVPESDWTRRRRRMQRPKHTHAHACQCWNRVTCRARRSARFRASSATRPPRIGAFARRAGPRQFRRPPAGPHSPSSAHVARRARGAAVATLRRGVRGGVSGCRRPGRVVHLRDSRVELFESCERP